jgi:hypothetical protein
MERTTDETHSLIEAMRRFPLKTGIQFQMAATPFPSRRRKAIE